MLADAFGNLCARPVVAVKRKRNVLVELWPVGHVCCPEVVKDRKGQTARILFRLQHEWWHGTDEHRLGHALAPVAADIARYLATARGVTDVNRILQIQRFGERR